MCVRSRFAINASRENIEFADKYRLCLVGLIYQQRMRSDWHELSHKGRAHIAKRYYTQAWLLWMLY